MEKPRELLDYESPVPYYSQLKEILLDQINRGVWNVGDPLPSHSELCEQYGVSKTVVRQALKELEYDGRIVQRRGKIACVAGPKITAHLLENLSGTHQDMTEMGYYPTSKILKQHVIPASEKIAARLEMEPGTEVIEIERLRHVNEEPFVLITSYLPYSLCPKISEFDLTDKSLLGILENEYGIVIAYSRRSIETTSAREDEAKLLEIKKDSPLLLFNSVSYVANGKAIGTTRALFRGDRARFDVELGQINNKDQLRMTSALGVRVARPGVEMETIEILDQPRRMLRDRVMMIPLIVINGKRWYHPPSVKEILAVPDADA